MLVSVRDTWGTLAEHHYLGPARTAAFAYRDQDGVVVFAAPRSRRLPNSWLELVRWCITGGQNAGSQQWSRVRKVVLDLCPRTTTIVSYSDPSQGHSGALYRASNWLWAPTWHRLRPPPSGNGEWTAGAKQSVKDRWIYPLRPDADRERFLVVEDASLKTRFPWCEYREPIWRRGRFDPSTGGGDYKRQPSSRSETR